MTKYHLSTEGFYFVYRSDKYNNSLKRATLYDKNDKVVDDIRVSAWYDELPEKSHTDVINEFESKITLGKIRQF